MDAYKWEGKLIFNIDDPDNFESFYFCVDFFKGFPGIIIHEYYPGGWGSSWLKFNNR